EELDANADGVLTPAEMEAFRAARFAAADTDGDGELSRAELLARAETQVEERRARGIDRMLERADADDNGTLSLAELTPGRADRMFDRLDANEDGTISAEEFEERMGRRGGGRHRN
ncbi:MAG: calcium-binding protein, partial [Pseudomonadota bacterium]